MCGITGALSFANSRFPITESYIACMRDAMAHRGPDGAGAWVSSDARVGLGHRRLSIIDLSERAAQPMCNEDRSIWVTFNGEIYNHAEIRNELNETSCHQWKTDHSDTEVIVHAFEEWGIDCIHRFRGMFAIGIWDARNRELWLIRDRVGIKPVYYSCHHNRIAFASEIKALLEDPEQPRSVNEEAFYHYLSFLTSPAPYTLFDGIQKLEAGTWLRVSQDGRMQKHRYWDVWDHTSPRTHESDAEIAECVLSELRTAVKLRKISDVPVGVFLSGGIDSSTNAALFSEGEGGPVRTFSIGYDQDYGSYPSELRYARLMAKTVGAEHHERLLTESDLLDFLPEMVRLQDEPIGDPVCFPLYYVSKLARDHGVIVCQVGEGADELYWGYPQWKIKLQLQQYDDLPVPRALKCLGLASLKALGQEESLPYEMLRRGIEGKPVFWGGAEAFTETMKKRVLSKRLQRQFADITSWDALSPIRERFTAKAWQQSHLNWMTYLDLNLRLPELLLMRVDKMSMGVSLEARVPFLDHKFVELAMSIPEAVKTRGGVLKNVLKKAVRGVIPDELIDRKKQGFGVPVSEWFMARLGNYVHQELMEFCRQTDFLDAKAVSDLIARKENGTKAWYLLNFVLWWKAYIRDSHNADFGTPLSQAMKA
jgi:asparagine synthase (glutamine-hydrolysing)